MTPPASKTTTMAAKKREDVNSARVWSSKVQSVNKGGWAMRQGNWSASARRPVRPGNSSALNKGRQQAHWRSTFG